jgi:hypothetical protein
MRFVTTIVSMITVVVFISCYLKHIDVVEERGITLNVRPKGIALVLMALISSAAAQRVEAASPEPSAIRVRAITQPSEALPRQGVRTSRGHSPATCA